MTASEPILQVRALTKRFQGLVAVDAVSFDIQAGEILGLIGPNGAGKTTAVSLISGTLAATSGDILYTGRNIAHLSAYRRARLGIGRTFQVMRPFPGLSVLDNVAVGALFGTGGGERKLARARAAAREWLEFVGLHHRTDQLADALGGPDRKRLELAKALAMQPKLLLLDEVMAGLNHVEIDEVIEVIHKVRDEGISILVIEHVMKAIQSLSDRLIVLHHGEKIAEGVPEQVLNEPEVIEAYLGRRRA
ncbi:MAG: ABC transporter ATP-binding protein [Gammaproteobacteria bacterium]